MLDIQFVKDNKEAIAEAIKNKGVEADLVKLLELDDRRRGLITEWRNCVSSATAVDRLRRADGRNRPETQAGDKPTGRAAQTPGRGIQRRAIPDSELAQPGHTCWTAARKRMKWSMSPAASRLSTSNPSRTGKWANLLTKSEPSALSGKRFSFLKGDFVLLQLALIQYGFDVLTDESVLAGIIKDKGLKVASKPFLPILPPTMMRTKPYLATNRLQMKGDTFKLAEDDLWLTGSAEHTLCAYFLGETLELADLPVRLVGYNTAYRREVGSAGKDTRGIIRQHQFDKLEMESFSDQETGFEEHKFMIAIQEYLMERLELPFKTVLKCTFDMGGPNIRGVDIETWMPGQDLYRETNSADYLGDYQARGLNTKFIDANGKRQLVHTNDATVFCQRHIVAILENNQLEDGRVRVPKVLQPYLKGREILG